ncbi:MAG: putative signal transducing protein [Bryobacteraceae bacterium]
MNSSDPLDLVPVTEEDGTPIELTEMEALELKNLLDANGIEAVIAGVEMFPNLPYRLQVPEGRAQEAARVIAEARAAGPAAAEEAEQEGEASDGGGAGI